jgi:Tfp pilus assembly protein PilN
MVPRVHINLSAPGANYLRLTQFGLNLLTVGALTLTGSFWWIGSTLNQQIDVLENQVSTVKMANEQLVAQAKTTGLDLSHQAIRHIPPQVTFVKQVRERVGFSWTQLLTDLETAIPPDITMNSVSLDEKTDTILLQGSAPSLPDLNRLIHQLDKHVAFQNVMLSQHANKNNKDEQGGSHIVFSLTASYASKTLAPHHNLASKHQ